MYSSASPSSLPLHRRSRSWLKLDDRAQGLLQVVGRDIGKLLEVLVRARELARVDPEPLFGLLSVGHVLGHAEQVERAARRIMDDPHRHPDPYRTSVLPHIAYLPDIVVAVAGDQPSGQFAAGLEVVRMRDLAGPRGEQLLLRVARDSRERPVDAQEPVLERDDCHPDRGLVEDPPEPLIALDRRPRRPLALRDLAAEAAGSPRPAPPSALAPSPRGGRDTAGAPRPGAAAR